MREGRNSNRSIELVSLCAVLFFLNLLSVASNIYGSVGVWSSCKGPGGGTVNALAIDPTSPQTIYAGTDGGVFKSADAGGSWRAANTGLTNNYIRTLAIDPTSPQTIYAGGGGVFKSTDAGGTWSAINTGLGKGAIVALAIDPASPQTIYGGGGWLDFDDSVHGGVYKSTNGGGSWNAINTGLPDTAVNALAIDPTSPQTIYAGTNGRGVFKSTNGGGSWIDTRLIDTIIHTLAIDPTSPQTIYAGTLFNGVFKSTDAGGSWSAVNSGLTYGYVLTLAIDPTTPQTLYAGTDGGVFKSTDAGGNWSTANTGLTGIIDVEALAIDPTSPQTIYVGSWGGGFFKSTNGGGSWSAINTGFANTVVFALAIDPSSPQTIYAATDYAGVFKSTDAGGSWIKTGLPNTADSSPFRNVIALAIDPTSPQTIYAGTDGGAVFKSTDGGGTWSAINTSMTHGPIAPLMIDPTSSQTIYAGTGEGLFKSTDGGGTWINMGLSYKGIKALAIDPISPQTIYAGTQFGVLKSTDAGGRWSDTGLPANYISSLAIDPTAPQTIYAGNYAGVFKSMDGGSSWSAANSGLTNHYIGTLAIDPTSPRTVYAATPGGVFQSTDAGSNWINTGLSNIAIYTLAIDPSSPQTIYAGSLGVWVYLPPCSSLSAGGATKCETAGASGATRVWYAKLAVKSGAIPYGTAVFSFMQNGITVTEAGVPASPPTASARIFVDYRSGENAVPGRSDSGTIDINTGIAVVNNGTATANVTYTLRDVNGLTLALGHGTVAAGRHFAKFITELQDLASDFSLPPNFQNAIRFGSLEIDSDQPLSVLGLRMTNNQRGEAIVTTTPKADLRQHVSYNPAYFAQFADGGGYTTSVMLLNTSSIVEQGTLQIRDNNGAPLVVNQVGGETDSSFKYSIPGGGAFHFQTDGSSADSVKVGWVQLIPDAASPAPVGSGVFSYNPGSILVSESGIPAVAFTTHTRVYVDLSRNRNTGLAIANVHGTAASIAINAFKTDGVTGVGTSQGPLKLAGYGHDAKFADQFISGLPAGFRGVLDISSATPFAALTLRSLDNERNEFLMTTFPVADANQAAPSPIVFPQVADGGGYVTEFILISAAYAADITLDYYDERGVPTDLGP